MKLTALHFMSDPNTFKSYPHDLLRLGAAIWRIHNYSHKYSPLAVRFVIYRRKPLRCLQLFYMTLFSKTLQAVKDV